MSYPTKLFIYLFIYEQEITFQEFYKQLDDTLSKNRLQSCNSVPSHKMIGCTNLKISMFVILNDTVYDLVLIFVYCVEMELTVDWIVQKTVDGEYDVTKKLCSWN